MKTKSQNKKPKFVTYTVEQLKHMKSRTNWAKIDAMTDEEADLSSYDYLFRADGVWKGHWAAEARPAVWDEDPEKALEHTEFRGILTHCLGELPERVANCFTLREMDGLQAPEICAILGISANNFWVMMHRARLHLRRCIDFNWFRKARD